MSFAFPRLLIATQSDRNPGEMFQESESDFSGPVGYLIGIMADHKQQQEFLGGGPKFNTVGKDNTIVGEPVVAVKPTGYWLRVAAVVVILVVLAGSLFFLNDKNLGKTTTPSGRGGGGVAPDSKDSPTNDPNLK